MTPLTQEKLYILKRGSWACSIFHKYKDGLRSDLSVSLKDSIDTDKKILYVLTGILTFAELPATTQYAPYQKNHRLLANMFQNPTPTIKGWKPFLGQMADDELDAIFGSIS